MRPIRVLFDTNAFSPEKFDAISSSCLRSLYRQRRILPLYSNIFIAETLEVYGSSKMRSDLLGKWLPYVFSTCQRPCRELHSILHEELVLDKGHDARILVSAKDYEVFKRRVLEAPLDGSWAYWLESREDTITNRSKLREQREVYKNMRKEFLEHLKKSKVKMTDKFSDFYNALFVESGNTLLPRAVYMYRPKSILLKWSRSTERYPFATTFVRDFLYMAWYAMIHHNDHLDENAQLDMELMSHLLRADVLVTEEKGFMRTAFENLWKPKGKTLMSVAQFTGYLDRLCIHHN